MRPGASGKRPVQVKITALTLSRRPLRAKAKVEGAIRRRLLGACSEQKSQREQKAEDQMEARRAGKALVERGTSSHAEGARFGKRHGRA